jgi:hypothetical protein
MTAPSKEAERRKVALIAIKRLLEGGWHQRGELFDKKYGQGRSKYWQHALLKRLIEWRVVERTKNGNSIQDARYTRYRVTREEGYIKQARELLTTALHSDEILTELLWPGTTMNDTDLFDHDDEEAADDAAPVEDLDTPADDADDEEVSPEEIQAALLKLMVGVVDKLDRVERDAAKARAAFDRLDRLERGIANTQATLSEVQFAIDKLMKSSIETLTILKQLL